MIVDGVYRTSDLVEATVLSLHGITPSMELESESDTRALFVFDLHEQDGEFISELLEDYRSSRFKVEPKRFTRELSVVRGLLYEFLRVDRKRLRLPQN